MLKIVGNKKLLSNTINCKNTIIVQAYRLGLHMIVL